MTEPEQRSCGNCYWHKGGPVAVCGLDLPWWAEPYERPKVYASEGEGCPHWWNGDDRADAAEALLAEATAFIRAEYEAKLDCVCLKDEDGKPRRDTVDELAREHVEEYEALLARLERSAP